MIQGKIYKLVNSADSAIYIGSTVSPLAKRFYQHKSKSVKFPLRKVYAHLVPIGWENIRIILIENYSCAMKEELTSREQYYIDLLNPSLNRNSAVDTCPHALKQCKCVQCHGSGICIHRRQRGTCKDCVGANICMHNRQRNQCNICNPVHCDFCNIVQSKAKYPRHLRTSKHKQAYVAEFFRNFEMTITEAEVPLI